MISQGEAVGITSLPPMPRSRRVGLAPPPSEFKLSSLTSDSSSRSSAPHSPTSPSTPSPPVPARSPLRPPPRPNINSSTASSRSHSRTYPVHRFPRPSTPPSSETDDFAAIAEVAMPLSLQMRSRSFPSLNGLLDTIDTIPEEGLTSKTLPLRPESPLQLSPVDDEPASSTSSLVQQPSMTKRQHALHELLSSERAYASDLALIRELHIPLALGQPVPLHPSTVTPPSSSGSSSRTQSTASDSSTGSLGPPMTLEDSKIIFGNIAELAIFSDMFCDGLEEALGSVLEGGEGEDRVGALFLYIIPELERPYKQYITRHSTALAHLHALPQTPALTSYLALTQTVASNLSHAWDISSLLIKPVQRLLKYSLLLQAIIEETPDSHGDKANLILAKEKMVAVANIINEDRRRAEVVKEVLTAKKKPSNVGVAASVNLGKIKNLNLRSAKAQDGNGECAQVERMKVGLKGIDVFTKQFARNIVDWVKMMSDLMTKLRVWAISFGKVIGLSEEQGSEAFDAFVMVVEQQLMPLCVNLEATISEKLLKDLAQLLATMNQPLKLLASMDEQEPFHYHLLNMNVSAKNRPPASLLEASTNYIALRGQLARELPQYLTLLHRGIAISVRQLAEIQTQFWGDVRDRWGDLWDMLRVEGEMNAGAEETVGVWQNRWADVNEVLISLNINNPKKLYQDPPQVRSTGSNVVSVLSSLDPPQVSQKRPPVSNVVNTLSALEPAHSLLPSYHSAPYVSAPQPLAPSKSRSRGMSDVSGSKRSLGRRLSNESLRSGKSGKSSKAKSPRRTRPDDYADFVPVMPHDVMGSSVSAPILPRMKSMPLPSGSPRSPRSPSATVESFDDGERGRSSRSSSLRRKLADSLRPSSSNLGQRYRSTSATSPTAASFFTTDPNAPPNPLPIYFPSSFSNARRNSWAHARAKYACQVVHPCQPPAAVSYYSFPFFTLDVGDVYEVLQEAGHPSVHEKLPLHVDDGEDCLLLCRDREENVGWALASFLIPLDDA